MLLTPIVVPEMGIAIIRPGRNQLALFAGRIVISPATDDMDCYQSGVIAGADDEHYECAPVLALGIDDDPPAAYMRNPKLQRWECETYTRWVKTQKCCGCEQPADDPHHIIGHGFGGTGTKVHDLFVIPLCRRCHDKLHRDAGAFEREHGSQVDLLFRFLNRALGIGAIVTGRRNKDA